MQILLVCIYVQIHFYKYWASTLTLRGQLKNKITSHLVISLPGDHHGDRTLQLVILCQTLCIIENFQMLHRGYVAQVSTLLCIDIVEATPTIDPNPSTIYDTRTLGRTIQLENSRIIHIHVYNVHRRVFSNLRPHRHDDCVGFSTHTASNNLADRMERQQGRLDPFVTFMG